MTKRRWFLAVVLLLGVLIAFAPIPRGAGLPSERRIHVDASQFSYDPGEIHVNQGDLVTIELTSTDSVHGLYVDGYGVSVTSDPGKTGILSFTADRPGSFRFRCNVTCGAMHPFMIGKLVVGQNEAFLRGSGLAALAAMSMILLKRPSLI